MLFKDVFKINDYKKEIQRLTLENSKLRSLVTNEHGKVFNAKIELFKMVRQQLLILLHKALLDKEIEAEKQKYNLLHKEVVELEETKLLQDFGLYKPMYKFANLISYKDSLADIRKQQKDMIKSHTAAICSTNWTVNNSRQEGRKMTTKNIQQVILTFNTECENAISNVKFSNYDSMKQRIQKSFDKLNKLNDVNLICITPEFLELKFKELALAFEYERKKQEEKEYILEQKEIQRENAKVQKELEEQRKKLEKEQSHYLNVLNRLRDQLESENDDEQKKLLREKIENAKDDVSKLEDAIREVDYRQANERAGYVYVISNIGAFGKDVYKIGMTRRLDPQDRIDELGGASVPFKFDVHAFIFSADAPKLETALHKAFADKRLNLMNNRKEFFMVTLEEIEKVVRENHDRTVDFTHEPIAEQFRESEKMREAAKVSISCEDY
jgi:hypothetical protein